jgi:endonuclease/exonuclease/phosphatase family metal-dependent hydrolase
VKDLPRPWRVSPSPLFSSLKPRGPDSGQRIDGFYVSGDIGTRDLRHLAETGSDHRPVQMTISVPS